LGAGPRSSPQVIRYDERPNPRSRGGSGMAEQKLVASVRQESGKGVARKLRADGRVPAVLYGQGADPLAISVDARELSHLLHKGGSNVLVDLVVDGDEHLAMPREIQRDHIKGRYWHIDFYAVSRTEKITVN